MQGAVFMPPNPQQGFSPPATTTVTEMEASPSPNQSSTTKVPLTSHNDSGIFSATNTTIDPQTDISKASETCDTDNRSDCSSPERKYFCPICDKMLTSQHEFTLHIRSHNNENEVQDSEKGYTCRICLKVLSSSSSLDRHVLVHSGERPFHCKYCGDTFTTNGNMHRHMRTHSHKSENSYESDGSTDSGSSKSTEYNNNKVEKSNNKRKGEGLESCNKKMRDDEHCHEPTEQSFRCPVCERSDFNSLTVLDTHLEDNHPDYPAKCTLCKQVFQNNKLLTAHKSIVHENSVTKQPTVVGFKDLTFVDFSSQKFPHIARMECETNMHKVSGGLKFQCRQCTRAFPCASSLEIHEKSCSPSQLPDSTNISNINQVEIRRMEFFSRLNLVDNSPEKPPPPPPPNKLREHLAKVMDNTKDLADIQSILSNINLQQLQNKQVQVPLPATKPQTETPEHQKNEEEESQDIFAVEFRKMKLRGEFPCRLCTAVFPNLRALKGHNRAHLNGTTNGTYHCNMCPHSSVDKAALIRHMRTHNGDRPYECSLCNYAFTTKANCERHLRNRHAKTTREEVKKSIIYHPSEDPTNEDLNKLAVKDEFKKNADCSVDRVYSSTPKLPDVARNSVIEHKPDVNMLKSAIPAMIPDLQVLKPSKMFSSIKDIIRNENLRSLRRDQEELPPPLPPQPSFQMSPQNLSKKIQVRSIETLRTTTCNEYDSESESDYIEEENDEPLDLVLDLSKKKTDEIPKPADDEEPQDLTKKASPPPSPIAQLPPSVGHILNQQLLKTPPKIDPAALYATQLALYRSGFCPISNWPTFPLNPLLFSGLSPNLPQNPQDIKERIQRFQLCGGSMISEEMKNLHNLQQQPPFPSSPMGFNGFKMEPRPRPELKVEPNYPSPRKSEDYKPLSLSVENNFGENLSKLHPPKPDHLQSPSSVKMVIKNGVLMPKQKQRRYRTERPFTCEHCSARFTLRSNMERHIKQQHPQYWSQRQRGNVGNPGRKPQALSMKTGYCNLSIPNHETPKIMDYNGTKDFLNEKLKYAILAQQLKATQSVNQAPQRDDDDDEDEDDYEEEDCELVIDENDDKADAKTDNGPSKEFDDVQEEEEFEQFKNPKNEENQDLVPVSRLLDNASQQQFKEFFKREGEEHEIGLISEEDEEGLIASGSTSEGNISGTDENRSESDTVQPVKKKSAYSLAPNRVSCPYCSRKFPWTSSLRRHILTHTGQKPFKCSHCPLLFTTKSNCDRHLLRKHGNAATTVANDPGNSNYLMRNVPERPFKCSSCPSSTFSTYSNLKKHITCKHATNAQGDDIKAQGYEAGSSEDEKIFELKNDWENHQVVANNPKPLDPVPPNSDLPFKCHLCEGSFSERQDALDHIRDKHASEYDLLMSKNALDANATTPDESAHQEDDDNENRGKFPDYSNRKVICAFCMRRFWSAEDLRRHMRTHTGERPFSCDICRRRFTLKHSMLRHRKKHNVNFEQDANASDEDGGHNALPAQKTDESDGCVENGGDLISNLLGLRDRSIIDKVLTASADDAAKLLGVRNGAKE